ncbi:MAG: hypothetical protein EP318_17410 [Rhodobacteraceae bacterium]|nr:MAG: hypothetical protein EP318_17410 [Paracoccaceae bacterium]
MTARSRRSRAAASPPPTRSASAPTTAPWAETSDFPQLGRGHAPALFPCGPAMAPGGPRGPGSGPGQGGAQGPPGEPHATRRVRDVTHRPSSPAHTC